MRFSRSRGSAYIGSAISTVLLVAGCASGPRLLHKHEYSLSPGQAHHAELARALLLPIDSTNEKPVRGLEIANDRITALVAEHLAAQGITVDRVDPHELRGAMVAAKNAVLQERKSGTSGVVSAEVTFEDVIPHVLEKLELKADLVVAPNIVMRAADYQGSRTIAWDGVKRRETVFDLQMSGGGLPAASIQVSVHSMEGTRVFLGYGGLEPVFRIDRALEKFVQREDLFQDDRNLREGICIAFYPYFGMEKRCVR
jgi:hypothetical protein